MNLKELIKSDEIEKELTYMRKGDTVKAFPKLDCTIVEGENELDQLRKVSGAYYFYGQISGELQEAISNTKTTLKSRTGFHYLKQHQELQNSKARITDKMLEHLVSVEPEIIKLKEHQAELEGAVVKIDTILTALRLKDGDLNELSRRNYLEAKTVNKLTK